MKIATTAFALSLAAMTMVACGGSSLPDPDDAPAGDVTEGEVSTSAEACPFLYRCGGKGAWYSTLAKCTAACRTCRRMERVDGYCIPH